MSRGVALIPARGGSRRVPRKNLRPFLGVPAIERVIGVLRDAGIVERVLVSTDDEEIAGLSRAAGAEVPAFRPPEFATDHASTIAVVRHAIDAWLPDQPSDTVVWVVYPTALLVTAEDLQRASERLAASTADFLVAVTRFPHPVERRLRIDPAGYIRADEPARLSSRTQDLPPAYHDAGQFYGGSVGAWMDRSPLEGLRTIGHVMDRQQAVDIDEPGDWELAEAIARSMLEAPEDFH
jgi:N-acylneuraminate cytidylyltransferase